MPYPTDHDRRARPAVEALEGRIALSATPAVDPTLAEMTPAATTPILTPAQIALDEAQAAILNKNENSAGLAPASYLFAPIQEGALLAEHIHPHLTIFINGQQQTIPALVGHIPYQGWLPLHTHDTSGTIHVEETVPYKMTVGDFFAVWGQTFTKTDLMGHTTGHGHKITMTVNGRPSNKFQNQVMTDLMQITIKYK